MAYCTIYNPLYYIYHGYQTHEERSPRGFYLGRREEIRSHDHSGLLIGAYVLGGDCRDVRVGSGPLFGLRDP